MTYMMLIPIKRRMLICFTGIRYVLNAQCF